MTAVEKAQKAGGRRYKETERQQQFVRRYTTFADGTGDHWHKERPESERKEVLVLTGAET